MPEMVTTDMSELKRKLRRFGSGVTSHHGLAEGGEIRQVLGWARVMRRASGASRPIAERERDVVWLQLAHHVVKPLDGPSPVPIRPTNSRAQPLHAQCAQLCNHP